jgi:flavin-binding protein dodecin
VSYGKGEVMATNNTYAISEIVGTSDVSLSEAIDNGVTTAAKTLRNLDWFEVVSMRGAVAGDAVSEYQVTMKVGFRYDT